jgi:hypothetical protein
MGRTSVRAASLASQDFLPINPREFRRSPFTHAAVASPNANDVRPFR